MCHLAPPATRPFPTAIDSEIIVLGRCVQSSEAITLAKAALTTDDFWQANHAMIFKAICAVDATIDTPILLQVTDILRTNGQLDDVGSYGWFCEAIDRTPTNSGLAYHLTRIVTTSAARRAASLALEVYEAASAGKDWWGLAEQFSALRPHDTPKPKRRFLGLTW